MSRDWYAQRAHRSQSNARSATMEAAQSDPASLPAPGSWPSRLELPDMSESTTSSDGPNPSGLCMCGCGRATPLATRTSRGRGLVVGQPTRVCPGHHPERQDGEDRIPDPNPSGRCQCGCGWPAPIVKRTDRTQGRQRGNHFRYRLGHHAMRTSPVGIIYDPVTECWNWQRGVTARGYGFVATYGKRTLAHRYFYELCRGPIPAGMDLDHLCRNRQCVNPWHLEPVTEAENIRRGVCTKLTHADVRAIRALYANHEPLDVIASDLGITRRYAQQVARGVTKWVAA